MEEPADWSVAQAALAVLRRLLQCLSLLLF
jgi:hypothetical protein